MRFMPWQALSEDHPNRAARFTPGGLCGSLQLGGRVGAVVPKCLAPDINIEKRGNAAGREKPEEV
jgi:hypothetical protein